MRRTSLVLAAVGGAAVLAGTGAAIGVTTADKSGPATAPAAVTADSAGAADDNAGTADDNPGADDSATAGTTPTRGAPTTAPRGAVDRQQAGRVALALLGAGRIVEIEAETEHRSPVWSVKVVRAGATYEIKVDRGDGSVVEVERRTADGSRTHDRNDDHGGDRSGGDD
ncbi:PepSY domain-containing protein [Micromonospora sp. AMSO31t]|uniref:PepSY domain-containing protein n=1 Tax=Micromonospora sp. AMSO31t TaxID=2650566 RepID=UPI001788AE53|nr:PepSY domain-containing protein [Micromonospora sp. AMSO31t]